MLVPQHEQRYEYHSEKDGIFLSEKYHPRRVVFKMQIIKKEILKILL